MKDNRNLIIIAILLILVSIIAFKVYIMDRNLNELDTIVRYMQVDIDNLKEMGG